MAALRELLESHGHTQVSPYIASGNVILSSDRPATAIKRDLEEALPKAFPLDSELIAALVLTLAQLRAVVRDRPKGSATSRTGTTATRCSSWGSPPRRR